MLFVDTTMETEKSTGLSHLARSFIAFEKQ
jgi:hypothetical protein